MATGRRGSSVGTLVTPEAVVLDLGAAGLGSRFLAAALDVLIQAVALGILTASAFLPFSGRSGAPPAAVLVVYLILAFIVVFGYFPLFEGLWNGRTPGKRAQGIRVVCTDGQPVTLGPVVVRNLVRVVDMYTLWFVGVICILVTPRAQRVGDLAAGTVVVRERGAAPPRELELPEPGAEVAGALDAGRLSAREYVLVRSFLQRRSTFTPAARAALAAQMAETVRRHVAGTPREGDDEAFLEEVARVYRQRFAPPRSG